MPRRRISIISSPGKAYRHSRSMTGIYLRKISFPSTFYKHATSPSAASVSLPQSCPYLSTTLISLSDYGMFPSLPLIVTIYGFVRATQGPAKGTYSHTFLIRGTPGMCDFMVRTKIKSGHQSTPVLMEPTPLPPFHRHRSHSQDTPYLDVVLPPLPPQTLRGTAKDGRTITKTSTMKVDDCKPTNAGPPSTTSTTDLREGTQRLPLQPDFSHIRPHTQDFRYHHDAVMGPPSLGPLALAVTASDGSRSLKSTMEEYGYKSTNVGLQATSGTMGLRAGNQRLLLHCDFSRIRTHSQDTLMVPSSLSPLDLAATASDGSASLKSTMKEDDHKTTKTGLLPTTRTIMNAREGSQRLPLQHDASRIRPHLQDCPYLHDAVMVPSSLSPTALQAIATGGCTSLTSTVKGYDSNSAITGLQKTARALDLEERSLPLQRDISRTRSHSDAIHCSPHLSMALPSFCPLGLRATASDGNMFTKSAMEEYDYKSTNAGLQPTRSPMCLREGRIRRRSSLGSSGTSVAGSFMDYAFSANHSHRINEEIESYHAGVRCVDSQMMRSDNVFVTMNPGMTAPPSPNQAAGALINFSPDTIRNGGGSLELPKSEGMEYSEDHSETLLELSFFDDFVGIFDHC